MSDSGMNAMRCYMDIPVIGPGRASYLMALMLGNRFSVVTQWDGWIPLYKKTAQEYGMTDRLASVRSINVMPDVENLLGGKEEVVFPKLVDCAMQCIEQDGAEVILLGSTTMHQAYGHMAENLPVPVINPGPLTYKLAECILGLGLTHSRKAYPKPSVPKPEMLHAMMDAAQKAGG
jgi:allantoin racemase